MKVTYAVIEQDPDAEERLGPVDNVDISGRFFKQSAAEHCAKHYWRNTDVTEASFPLTLVVFDESGEHELGRYVVDMRLEPIFSASVVPAEAEGSS